MTVSGVSESEYKQFLSHGGDMVFYIDATDVDSTGGFESSPLIQPYLFSGFELRPAPIIEQPRERAMILLYGGSWTNVIAYTYTHGGQIIYKKLPDGRYEAKASVPAR